MLIPMCTYCILIALLLHSTYVPTNLKHINLKNTQAPTTTPHTCESKERCKSNEQIIANKKKTNKTKGKIRINQVVRNF